MASDTQSLAALVDEAAERLSADQLFALAARVAAAERREPEDAPEPDLATSLAFDLELTVRRLVNLWTTAVGVDPDIVAAWLLPALVRAGVPEMDALAVLQRQTGWCPRTGGERLEVVAREMLADGFTPTQVRRALKEAESAA